MKDANLLKRLEETLDTGIKQLDLMPVGFGLSGAVATLDDGTRFAVKAKTTDSAKTPSLAVEGSMLRDLARLSSLPVPAVHVSLPDLLVMDFIDNDGGPITPDVERDAAPLIAALHAEPRSCFGYERDTLIGPLRQPNLPMNDWVPFFRDHRLRYMAEAAHEEDRLPTPLYERLERFVGDIDSFLSEPPFPSLLHGDLWTGNVLVKGNRIAGVLDPAIHYGHREVELAFTTMFGTFGRAFFEAYEEILPLEPGFHEERREIYNLYPTLVHVRLFGANYLSGIDSVLTKHGY